MAKEPTARPDKPTSAPKVPAPPPPPTPAGGNEDLARRVADLAVEVVEQGRQTTEAVGRLNKGLEAFGRVGESVDKLTDALLENQRFVREQQVLIRRRQRDAAAEYAAHVTEGMTPGTPPAGDPEG